MKKFSWVAITTMLLSIAGCGDHSRTSSGGEVASNLNRVENVIDLDSAAIIYVAYENTAEVGEEWEILIKLRASGAAPGETVGTIHWGDFTDDRVRDGMTLTHSYQSSGSYTFAIQIDGDEKKIAGTVTVLGSQTSGGASAVFVSALTEASGIFSASTCSPANANISFSDLPIRLAADSTANPVPAGYGRSKNGIVLLPTSCSAPGSPTMDAWGVGIFRGLNTILDVDIANCGSGGTVIGRQEVTDAGFEGVVECQWTISPP